MALGSLPLVLISRFFSYFIFESIINLQKKLLKKNMKLGVNIDHVATIRNARGGKYPSPIKAAEIAEKWGQIHGSHLREDRRHIKEQDIQYIIKNIKIPLQLEIAPTNLCLICN